MTETSENVQVGDQITWARSGFVYAEVDHDRLTSRISQRAETITITPGMLHADTHDREGNHWLDCLNDPDEQVAKWGEVVALPGPRPDNMRWYKNGTVEQEIAHQDARKAAYAIPEGPERDAALTAVKKEFGKLNTSTELWRSDTGRSI